MGSKVPTLLLVCVTWDSDLTWLCLNFLIGKRDTAPALEDCMHIKHLNQHLAHCKHPNISFLLLIVRHSMWREEPAFSLPSLLLPLDYVMYKPGVASQKPEQKTLFK
jgi:hypothetical protein